MNGDFTSGTTLMCSIQWHINKRRKTKLFFALALIYPYFGVDLIKVVQKKKLSISFTNLFLVTTYQRF